MTRRPYRPQNHQDRDRGSMSMELVVLAPIVIALLLVVVGFGRYAHGNQLIERAAAVAARSASLASTPAEAVTRASRAASSSLADAGMSCAAVTIDVDTTAFRPGGTVNVTLSCTADLSDLALAGLPGTAHLTATGRAPLESYRQFAIPGAQP